MSGIFRLARKLQIRCSSHLPGQRTIGMPAFRGRTVNTHSFASSAAAKAGMSAGSCCPSASMNRTFSERVAKIPVFSEAP